MKDILRFGVGTDVGKDGTITQVTSAMLDGIVSVLSQEVFDLREAGVRDALIRLGWTPPKGGEGR
jgi:hypothetical protein